MRGVERRREILGHVREHPGATIKEVAAAIGITHPTAMYHLSALEGEGAVQSHRYGNRRHYFDAGVFDAWERRCIMLILSPENARVLDAIWREPLTYCAEVAEQKDVSRLTVTASARRFESLGLVRTAREGRTRRLTVNHAFAEKRWRALLGKLPENAPVRGFVQRLVQAAPPRASTEPDQLPESASST